MAETELLRLTAHIRGRVQGVYYRATIQHAAIGLSITGWARNNADGTVHVVAEGSQPALEMLIKYLWRGSDSAHVTDVEYEWATATGKFDRFRIRY